MNIDAINEIVVDASRARQFGEWVVVPTTCSYPSNRTVQIFLLGGKDTVRAYDGGGAFDELDAAGEHHFDAFKVLRKLVAQYGASVDGRGWIGTEPVAYEELPGVIAHLASVSVKASELLMQRRKRKKLSDLRVDLSKMLVERYSDAVHRDGHVLGLSNKPHRFDFLIDVGKDNQLVVDAATPDPNSINAIVVRHLDVRGAKPTGVSQLIVFDDRDTDWKSEDLSLLRTGGRPLAFTHLSGSLNRLEEPPGIFQG